MAEGDELLGRERAVGKLGEEEHRGERRHCEGVEDPRLLDGRHLDVGQIAEDERQPGAQMKNSRNIMIDSLVRTPGAECCSGPSAMGSSGEVASKDAERRARWFAASS